MSTDQEKNVDQNTPLNKEDMIAYLEQQRNEAIFSQVYGISCALLSNNIVFEEAKREAIGRYKKDKDTHHRLSPIQELTPVGHEISMRAMAVNDGIMSGINTALELMNKKKAESRIVVPEKKLIVPE